MNHLASINDFMVWLHYFKGHILLILFVIDSFLVSKLAKLVNNSREVDRYVSLHIRYGVYKTNIIKIFIGLLAFLVGPGPRDTWILVTVFILAGIVVWNFVKLVTFKLSLPPEKN